MAGLGNLSTFPREILDKIFDGLCVHHVRDLREYLGESAGPYNSLRLKLEAERLSFKGLASLCRASRHLNQLATWRLYHSLVGSRTRRNWLLIARTLVERRDLGGLVRHLTLDDVVITHKHSPFLPVVLDYFAEQIALDADNLISEGSRYGTMPYHAVLALMTCLYPNLSTLAHVSPIEYTTIGSLSPHATMLSLRDVQVSHWDTEGGYELDLLLPIIRAAPNIKLLRLVMVGCCEPLEEELRLEHLTDLELQCCCLTADELACVLGLCPNLRRLQYQCGGPSYGDEQFGPREAVAAVLEHTPKLEKFELDLVEWREFEEFTEDDVREAKLVLERRGIECRFAVDYDKQTSELNYIS